MNEERLKLWKEKRQKRLKSLNHETLLKGILAGDLTALSSGITLLESNRSEDKIEAQKLINSCLKYSGKSIRLGITGVPGVGKSTFIESFGQMVVEKGHKLAVLAIDPSSEKSGGSILGDKTRMTNLSVLENAFIRPSAAGKSLGGVARKTRESIILCEAAGYDFVLIETVGVGQSETIVHSMVDFFMLLMLSGAGDELQGIKRGIMEMADALIITKADGDNKVKAQRARQEYEGAMHLFPPNENGWVPKTMIASSLENYNIEKAYNTVQDFVEHVKENDFFYRKRKSQDKYWLHETIVDVLLGDFYSSERIADQIPQIEDDVVNGKISSFEGAERLIKLYYKKID